MPGSYALELKSSARDLPFSVYFDFVARSGRALVYPVYSGTYERRRPGAAVGGPSMAPAMNEERDEVVRWAKDFSRTLDYLGIPWRLRQPQDCVLRLQHGVLARTARYLGVERRLATAILLTGGIAPVAPGPEVNPVNFLPRTVLPVLMLGGRIRLPSSRSRRHRNRCSISLGTPARDKRLIEISKTPGK